ncbi:50S ribosomal protein L6 [Lactobacillus selangorensis]|uniref:Large ribosomal subunit protein uL6 n=1 Tax=Lactobacillus selangorensis TaxID=81857 RepID=A0A0R2FLR1_9LACO|nr:50S ribosomal protein L6 [Lactobacillus selangorensis]KRN29150.1 50S ribosomal protein L6 [Lactobacillus selangorensis]KRN31493.1 50S ribosomal protein L6 [Lactobacillus selangorensis]
MSRIGNKVITLPAGVTVSQKGNDVTVKGPKGELTRAIDPIIEMHVDGNEVSFTRPSDDYKAIHGTTRANVNNMVIGVTEGYKKDLKLVGVGYRAQMKGKNLVLSVGYSHPVEMTAPEGIEVAVPSNTEITVSGISKQRVGQFAAEIRAVRSPEPYKGKGIRYVNEYVRRKEGKTGK